MTDTKLLREAREGAESFRNMGRFSNIYPDNIAALLDRLADALSASGGAEIEPFATPSADEGHCPKCSGPEKETKP